VKCMFIVEIRIKLMFVIFYLILANDFLSNQDMLMNVYF
jgi:hypothetical protein